MIDARSLGFRHSAVTPWLFADLSFSLEPGKTLVLLGRNGRGKTTLLKCLAGLLTPTSGSVHCDGMVGYVPQQFVPVFSYSVFDIVLMGVRGMSDCSPTRPRRIGPRAPWRPSTWSACAHCRNDPSPRCRAASASSH